ncbi:MAG: helix-turn-helix domain-containing protein [Bacteroidia bacterium]
MITLPKAKKVTFPSLEIGIEELDMICFNFHARINGFIINKLPHEIQIVVDSSCKSCNVEIDDFYSSSRKSEVVLARMLVIVYAISNYKWSLKKTGEHIGGRDHATVLSLYRRYNDYLEMKDQEMLKAKTKFIECLRLRNELMSVLMLPYRRKINKKC